LGVCVKNNSLECVVNSLVRELEKLAPHPASPAPGPVFIAKHDLLKKPADYDSTLGMMMAENFLASAFFGAANQNDTVSSASAPALTLDWSNAMDAASEYLEDCGEGQGSFARVKWKTAKAAFDAEPALAAYRRDLPKRLKIEAALAHYLRKIEALAAPAPSLAA